MEPKKTKGYSFKDEKFLINICDQEPIHIPGSIQSFGCALVLDPASKILFASENLESFIGVQYQSVLGEEITNIINDDDIISSVLLDSTETAYFFNRRLGNSSKWFDLAVLPTTSLGYRTIEIEPASEVDLVDNQFYAGLDSFEQANSEEKLLDLAAKWVKNLIYYDRVKVYLFDEFWNGKVVAEAKADHMPSYLGLRFPASDIPKQARALYLTNKVRVIADVYSKRISILPEVPASQAIDLTHSGLRSVSPIHIEYLKNMAVGASFSVSIVQNNKLLGLIACHHSSAKNIGLRTRKKAELIGRAVSVELKRLTLERENQLVKSQRERIDRLNKDLRSAESIEDALHKIFPDLTILLEADGLAYSTESETITYGLTLDPEEIKAFENTLEPHEIKEIFKVRGLAETHLNLVGHEVAGILRIPLFLERGQILYAFRKERVTDVLWGGADPSQSKEISTSEDGKLRVSPRKSFEVYKQRVKGLSEPCEGDVLYAELRNQWRESVSANLYSKGLSEGWSDRLTRERNEELKKIVSELRLEVLQLKGVEHKLNLALEVGAIGSWELDIENQEVELDARAMEILETYHRKLSLEGFIALFPRSNRELLRKSLLRGPLTEPIYTDEITFKRSSQDESILLLRAESISGKIMGILMDVTDVRSLQKDIQATQNELAQFFNTDLIGTFVANEDGDILQCNDYFLEVLGYDRTFFENSALNWRTMSPIDQYPRDMDMIRQTMMGERVSYEKQFFTSEGRRLDTLFGLSFNSELHRFYGLVKNNALEVVERNRTERIIQDQRKMLLERHEKLQKFNRDLMEKNRLLENEITIRKRFQETSTLLGHAVSNTAEMILITDSEFVKTGNQPQILYANDALLKLTGYSEEEVIGSSPKIFQNEKTDPVVKARIHSALKAYEPIQTRIINQSKSGREYVAELSLSPVFDEHGNCTHFIGVQRDVTEEVERIANLKKAQLQFKLISENLPEAIVAIVDERGKIEYLGGKNAALLDSGVSSIFNAFTFTNSTQEVIQNWLKAHEDSVLSVSGQIKGQEFELIGKTVGAISDRPEIVLLAQNVSARKEVLRLKELAVEEAAQLAAMKTQFINTASHQLKTPMSSIELNLTMLDSVLSQQHDQRLHKIVERLRRESSRLLSLMEDTLQISRINSDSFELMNQELDLVALVQGQKELFENTIEYQNRLLTFQSNVSECLFLSDHRLIEQMVHNLISNALKYSEKEVIIELRCTPDHKEICIQDFGIGIPETEIDNTLNEFYRATNSKHRSGTGLGLFLVNNIVKKIGGELSIESKENEGSIFKIRL